MRAGVFVTARPKNQSAADGMWVYAFDKRTGRQLWKPRALGGRWEQASLAFGSGKLITLNTDGVVRALNPANGKVHWKRRLAAPRWASELHSSDQPVTVRAGVAYVNFGWTGDNYIALHVATGKTKWVKWAREGALGPAVSKNRVYLGGSCVWEGYTLGGKLLWHDDRGCQGGEDATSAVVSGNRLWLHTDIDRSRAYDAGTGKLAFSFDSTSIPVVVGRRAFLTSDPGLLTAVDSTTGEVVWSRKPAVKYEGLQGQPIATSKVVYLTTGSGWVVGYSTATGGQVWAAKIGATIDPTAIRQNVIGGSAIGGGVLAVPWRNRLAVFG
jgi:outer membrane protein assembly factor BamB